MTTDKPDKEVVNPRLIAALEHYASSRYNSLQPSVYVHTDGVGHQTAWCIERTCGLAHEILVREELNLLKLRTLQRGLKKYGLERAYEIIMGEKLPNVL